MKHIQLNTSYKDQSMVGLGLGIWLTVFLIFISPFDVSDLTFEAKLILLPPYGVLVFGAYMLCVFFQNKLYWRLGFWNIKLELLFFVLLYLTTLLFCFPYYKSNLVNGTYTLWEYVIGIYVPILALISVFVIVGRMYINRLQSKKDSDKILLKGDNKSDILKVEPEKIVCISSTQNYVEVYYLLNDSLKKTLLRGTLKSITSELDELKQVHRSHFVNPSHFVKWIDGNTIQVNDLKIAVSKKYKEELRNII
ncbi:LytTR family DNA-binding domain-containing protein [Spongiivirga citrea]|uniref:HTH LytTR-type domain-containing protein n=1 Tax=Spongiivirga citrea TaxID=1481457 RepID=A0A6M0CP83_9FLAO|nr:LytTR family DNA-binding domain-containing protein [Spongiivirga citrea]NER17679.1 hypothetical protein [Spongiivirga citrea]